MQGLVLLHDSGLVHVDLKMDSARLRIHQADGRTTIKLTIIDLGSAKVTGSGERPDNPDKERIVTSQMRCVAHVSRQRSCKPDFQFHYLL